MKRLINRITPAFLTLLLSVASLAQTPTPTPQTTLGGNVTVSGDLNVTGKLNNPDLDALAAKAEANRGVTSFEEQEYYRLLNTTLEPDAIEPIKRGAYTYVVGPNETKVGLSIWHSAWDVATGRVDVRLPSMWVPLHDTTLYGIYAVAGKPLAGSHAVIADPSRAVYADPKATYYSRQYQLNFQLRPTSVGITIQPGADISFRTDTPAVCGTYGCILIQATRFDAPYTVILHGGGGWQNVDDEEGDQPQAGARVARMGVRPNMPLTGYMLAAARVGPGAAENDDFPPKGSITFINLPPTWSKVPDPRTWLFRDDSWGVGTGNADIDLTKWDISDPTPSSSTTGVTINPRFKWHEMAAGSAGTYGTVAMRSTQTFTRAAGLTADLDFYAPGDAQCAVGWADTEGAGISDWAHALVFETQLNAYRYSVWEDNTFRTQSGMGSIIPRRIYHIQVTTNEDGSATYRLQGAGWKDAGGNLAEPGSNVWATLNVPGSASAKDSLKLVTTCASGVGYFRNLKVSAAPQ